MIAGLVVVAGVFAALFFKAKNENNETTAESTKLVVAVTGMEQPLPKMLDGKFKDTNGDLVADVPTDKSKLIDPDTLVFSFVADNPADFKVVWKDFTDYLSSVTGKKVEYSMAGNIGEQIRDFSDGKIQVTGINTGSVPLAVNMCGFVPVVTMGKTRAGAQMHMEIIVPADSGIQSVDDVRGHTITFVDPNSNSGCKAAMVILKTKFDLLPGRDYFIRYSQGQEKSILGVAYKTYEAAAVASDVLERDVTSGKISKTAYRTIFSSDDFPAVALGYAYNLTPELAAKVREAFATFKFEGSSLEKRFSASGQDGFLSVNYKEDFTMVRFIDDQIGKPYRIPPVDEPPTTMWAMPTTGPSDAQMDGRR